MQVVPQNLAGNPHGEGGTEGVGAEGAVRQGLCDVVIKDMKCGANPIKRC